MLTRILKLAGIGFLIGIVVGNTIAFFTGSPFSEGFIPVSDRLMDMASGNTTVAIVLQSLFSGIYGAICFVGVLLHDIERLPMAAAAVLHYLLIAVTYIPGALFLGWVNDIISVLITAGIQLVIYFIIWLIMFAIYKKQIKELNEMQKDFAERKERTK